MIGLVGGALFFFLLLIAAVVVGMVLFAYASYCFLVVVNATAAGADSVKWPNQPYIEWAGKFVYFAWLISFGLVPAVLLVWLVAPDLLDEPLGTIPVLAGVVWIVFPVLLLSSLSNRHPMAIFHLGLIRRLLLRPGSLAAFYVLTGILLAGGVTLGVLGLRRGALLLVAVPAG